MVPLADAAFDVTVALLATFGGIGLIVTGLIVYSVVLARNERIENIEDERREQR